MKVIPGKMDAILFELRNLRHGSDFLFQSAFQFFSGNLQIIVGLEIDPTLRVGAKEPREPQGCISRNGSFSGNDFAYAPLRDS
jgi:hypothetical protein